MTHEQDPEVREHLMQIVSEFPYAGLSLSFLAMDNDCPKEILERALDQVSIDDLEQLYIYELENIPETVRLLRKRGIDRDLIKRVFDDENKDLKDKEQTKL